MLYKLDSRSIFNPFDPFLVFFDSGLKSCFFSISSNILDKVDPAPLRSWASSALARSTFAVRLLICSWSSLPPLYWLRLCGRIWNKGPNVNFSNTIYWISLVVGVTLIIKVRHDARFKSNVWKPTWREWGFEKLDCKAALHSQPWRSFEGVRLYRPNYQTNMVIVHNYLNYFGIS